MKVQAFLRQELPRGGAWRVALLMVVGAIAGNIAQFGCTLPVLAGGLIVGGGLVVLFGCVLRLAVGAWR